MKVSVKKSEVEEVIAKLNAGFIYSNGVAGYTYASGNVNLKMYEVKGELKMKFYDSIEEMAKAIVRSLKTGI